MFAGGTKLSNVSCPPAGDSGVPRRPYMSFISSEVFVIVGLMVLDDPILNDMAARLIPQGRSA